MNRPSKEEVRKSTTKGCAKLYSELTQFPVKAPKRSSLLHFRYPKHNKYIYTHSNLFRAGIWINSYSNLLDRYQSFANENLRLDKTDPTYWSNITDPTLLDAACWIRLNTLLDDGGWSNGYNMLVQQHPSLSDATCWIRLNILLDDGGWSNVSNMLVQHHPSLLDAACWIRLNTLLDDGGWSNGFNMLVQHHPSLLDAACWIRLNTLLDDDGWTWTSLVGYIFPTKICPTCSTNNVKT